MSSLRSASSRSFVTRSSLSSSSSPKFSKNEDERLDRLETLHKILIAGAFYPNYFLRVAKDERDSLKELSGLNPFSTVLLSGVPPDQGPLYKDQINAVAMVRLIYLEVGARGRGAPRLASTWTASSASACWVFGPCRRRFAIRGAG